MELEGFTLIRANAGKERLVIVSAELFDRLLDVAENKVSPPDLGAWVNSPQNQNELPITLTQRLTSGETPHRVYREYRGITTIRLAETTGLPHDYILALERGDMVESLDARRRIAGALDLRLDDLERR